MNTEMHRAQSSPTNTQSAIQETSHALGDRKEEQGALVFPPREEMDTTLERALDRLPAGSLWVRTRDAIVAAKTALEVLPAVDIAAMTEKIATLKRGRLVELLRNTFSSEYLEALGMGRDGARLTRRSHRDLTLITLAAFHGFVPESDVVMREAVASGKTVPCLAPPLRVGISAICGLGAAVFSSSPLLRMGLTPECVIGISGVLGILAGTSVRNRMWQAHGNEYFRTGRAVEELETRVAIAGGDGNPLKDVLPALFVDPQQPMNEANRLRAEAFLIARGHRIFDASGESFADEAREVEGSGSALESIYAYLSQSTFLPDGQGGVWSSLSDLYLHNPSGMDREVWEIFDSMNNLFFSLAAMRYETQRREFARLVLDERVECQA